MLIPSRLLAVAKAASKDLSRPQLMGVLLERPAECPPSMTVTDGKVLISTTWAEDDNQEFPSAAPGFNPTVKPNYRAILPSAAALEVMKAAPKRQYKKILEQVAVNEEESNGRIPLQVNDLDNARTFSPAAVEGTYPAPVAPCGRVPSGSRPAAGPRPWPGPRGPPARPRPPWARRAAGAGRAWPRPSTGIEPSNKRLARNGTVWFNCANGSISNRTV